MSFNAQNDFLFRLGIKPIKTSSEIKIIDIAWVHSQNIIKFLTEAYMWIFDSFDILYNHLKLLAMIKEISPFYNLTTI